MKFLLDTNIFIPLEPTSSRDIGPNDSAIATFHRLLIKTKNEPLLHPEQILDIESDQNKARRELRLINFSKYPLLPKPPSISNELKKFKDVEKCNRHDLVDCHLLSAVVQDAVDYLVTEDRRLIKLAVRLGARDRVLNLAEALFLIRSMFQEFPTCHPQVEDGFAHQIPIHDPILDSLRVDYPPFDEWLSKCKREHRKSFLIFDDHCLAGLSILNLEKNDDRFVNTKTLKICTFKISEKYAGFRYGELLLKAIFDYSWKHKFEQIFIEVKRTKIYLINFLRNFGFITSGHKRDQIIFLKQMKPSSVNMEIMNAYDYFIRFGPYNIHPSKSNFFVIPIMPKYHNMLFPEYEDQGELFTKNYSFSNSIRKAYLCRSKITKISRGDTLLFYRSGDVRRLTYLGVVETFLRASDPNKIHNFVGKITVYDYDEIKAMCRDEMLAIVFRQGYRLSDRLTQRKLIENRILRASPQSIQEIDASLMRGLL